MVVRKRCLAWDWTDTRDCPQEINNVDFDGPMHSVSNWNVWEPPELKGRAAFRPMIHLQPELEGEEWQTLLKSDADIVHYFNEPERNGISSDLAAQKWHEQVVPQLRKLHHKKLVSPSCAGDDAGVAWLKDFMNKVKDEPPDFVGVHYYGTSSSDAKKFLHKIHDEYPKQKLIVSEIASISRKKQNVYAFTRNMANWMDQTDWIFEYTFFGCLKTMPDDFVSPQARLMSQQGKFTKLMKLLMHEQPITKAHKEKAQAGDKDGDAKGKAHESGGKAPDEGHQHDQHDKNNKGGHDNEQDEPDDDDPEPKPKHHKGNGTKSGGDGKEGSKSEQGAEKPGQPMVSA
ncbi:hypothetical protein Dda_1545 [Drechslerella dactyloides]|uniref:Asl1-like glycosyl hydrolase catalytic domain-containing protein n=1 Tax=Drechslerella dactyloides TaxID=74499 RepID=A0AAD6NLW7_DREDA|nr:hypothetical protein Dda_1545 [Drechslerella dactyloides]